MTKHLNKSSGGGSGPSRSPSKGKESPNTGKSLDLRDCPLSFPEFPSVDTSSVVPRYSSVLKRSESEGISLEDVDALQMELEALLSSTVVRKITLKEEHKSLTSWESNGKRHGTGNHGRSAGKRGPSSPGKKAPEDRYGKKHRLHAAAGGKPFGDSSSSFGKVIGIPKISKTEPKLAPNFDPLQNEQIRPLSETAVSPSPKNETPGRFWAFVEPYCAPITLNDVQLLEDLIHTHDDLSDYYVLPKKGKHYTRKWAEGGEEEEEIEEEESDSKDGFPSPAAVANNNHAKSPREPTSNAIINNNSSSSSNSTNGELGDLTQRLVAGLMENNPDAPLESLTPSKAYAETNGEVPSNNAVTFSQQAESLEAHVFKELEEQGIFDSGKEEEDEGSASDENDEIFQELKRCQKELRALSGHNLLQLKRLMKCAKEELIRQDLRSKLSEADKRVMEAYKKISLSRSQKKEPNKKDKDFAWKALKERELILKQLESV